MAKPKTLSQLKKLAWKEFSKYIRLKYANDDGRAKCYTCGKEDYYTNLQAGHLLDGRYNSILFEEKGVRPQCPGCNLFKSGNKEVYIPKWIDQHGRKAYDKLVALKNQTKKFSRKDLEEIRDKYKKLSDENWKDEELR